jgi:class 3 adenylate cyclase
MIHAQVLDDGLRRTGALVSVKPEVLAKLRALVETGTDAQLHRINPVAFAKTHGLDRHETVSAFVGASKAGLFSFTWSLTCPLCGSYAHTHGTLGEVTTEFFCAICNSVSPASMDSLVEVAFAVHETVRPMKAKFEQPMEGEQWLGTYQNKSAKLDPEIIALIDRNKLWSDLVRGASEQTADVKLTQRRTRVAAITHNSRVTLDCPVGQQGATVEIDDEKVTLISYKTAPGISIRNKGSREAVLSVSVDIQPEDFKRAPVPTVFDGFLSGRDLLCNQAFRDLYGSETLSAGIAVHVENQSVLFTDLKGSTQLYDSIGDLRAFALVSEHFKILLAAVQDCGGAVVKTIGDAVMATFPETKDGVRAALRMASLLGKFNATSGLPPLSLKIGLHVGPCIVVSSNGRPDYFGQTVNIAARVQALAEGDELVLTDVALRASEVGKLLEPHAGRSQMSQAALKGVAEKVKVHTFQLG